MINSKNKQKNDCNFFEANELEKKNIYAKDKSQKNLSEIKIWKTFNYINLFTSLMITLVFIYCSLHKLFFDFYILYNFNNINNFIQNKKKSDFLI